jgi:predicted HD phosphohydrolase
MTCPKLDRSNIVEFIAGIFERRGAGDYLGEAVRGRIWDDQCKQPGMKTPAFRYDAPLLERVVARQAS